MTQNQRVLKHLEEHGSITRREAMNIYGIANLPARISELRQMGYNITNEDVHDRNQYGEKTVYTRYHLEADNGRPVA